jgi:septal ring factor EnvC (AmiA/AmiB activator)
VSAHQSSSLCHCPTCQARSATILLESGRTAMALAVLRSIPAAPTECARLAQLEVEARELEVQLTARRLDVERLQGRVAERRQELAGLDHAITQRQRVVERLDRDIASRQRELARIEGDLDRLKPPRQGQLRPYQQLAEALATGRITAGRVAEMLKVEVADVVPIAAGRVTLASTAWCRLLEKLG